jgi:hypothetical protein
VKNRFLMRIKNVTPGVYRRHWLAMTLRDLTVLGASIFWEPTSLAAFWHVARGMKRALRHRRAIMSRRRVSDDVLAQWFSFTPAAQPIRGAQAGAVREVLTPAVPLAAK